MRLHLDCLHPKVAAVWPALGRLPREYVLVGGTALALHWGHRMSFDVDLDTGSAPSHPRTTLRALGMPTDRRLYKWPRRKTHPYIHIRETESTPKIDVHGKSRMPCLHSPRRAANGLLVAHPADLMWRKLTALIGRERLRDAEDAAEFARDRHGLSEALVLDAMVAVHDGDASVLVDLSQALCLEANVMAWREHGLDVDALRRFGDLVESHKPGPVRFASGRPEGDDPLAAPSWDEAVPGFAP